MAHRVADELVKQRDRFDTFVQLNRLPASGLIALKKGHCRSFGACVKSSERFEAAQGEKSWQLQ